MKFSIIATGYNCESYAKECIESVLAQTYTNWELLIYNDASTDDTASICQEYVNNSKNIWLYNAKKNKGALYGRYFFTHSVASGDVVCFLGLDDKLTPNALEVLTKYYTDKVRMTWGNWINTRGHRHPVRNYDQDVWDKKTFRTAAWRATALNTFRLDLLKSVPKEELLMNGEFYTNCTDLAYSFPCLERIEKHEAKVVTEPIYIYNDNHANTTRTRLGKAHKTAIREHLKRRK